MFSTLRQDNFGGGWMAMFHAAVHVHKPNTWPFSNTCLTCSGGFRNFFQGFITKLEYINIKIGGYREIFLLWSTYPLLAGTEKHFSQISSELCLLHGEVVEQESFTKREQREKKKKNEENKENDREHRVWFEKNNKQLS